MSDGLDGTDGMDGWVINPINVIFINFKKWVLEICDRFLMGSDAVSAKLLRSEEKKM